MRKKDILKKTTFSATVLMIMLSALSITPLVVQEKKAYAHHVVEEIAAGNGPLQMSLANNTLYVANIGQDHISVIDTVSDKGMGTINATGGTSTLYAVPQLGKLYVSMFEQPRLQVYDLKTLNFVKNITLPGAVLDYWYNPREAYKKHVFLPTGGSSMDYDPTTGLLYVAIYNHDHVEVIDTKTDSAIKTIDLSAHPSAVKVDPQTQMVLVTSTSGNRLSFISTKTNEVIGSINTGNAPWDLAIDMSTHTAYITHMASYYVAAVSIPTREIVAKVPVTSPAQAITVDSYEHKVYLSTIDGQSIIKLDGKTNEVETVIDIEGVPSYLLADSTTHRVYASTNLNDKVVVIGPHAISATFPVITVDNPTAVIGMLRVHGQDVVPSAPTMSLNNKTLTLFVESQDGGNLTLVLPRSLLDSHQGASDSPFQVMIAGKSTTYQEGQPVTESDGTQSRVITMYVPKGSNNLQILGTQVLPEFGSLTLTVLGIALVCLIAYARGAVLRENRRLL